jgi:monoamine oxidase
MLSFFSNYDEKDEAEADRLQFLPQVLAPYSTKLWEYRGKHKFEGKVVVVGAGIAGLTAAYYLQKQGIEVELLEASNQAGGRIQTNRDFADFPIELGAEWMHGEKTAFFKWMDQLGAQFYEDASEEMVWFGGRLQYPKDDRQVRQWGYAVEELEDMEVDDISLWQWALDEGFSHEMRDVVNHTANELGTSANRLGVKAYAAESRLWSAGELDFKFDGSFYDIINALLIKPLANITRVNCPITDIRYGQSKIFLKTDDLRFFTADRVIVTVPLSILQSGMIQFQPQLPIEKLEAISKIGIDAGMKVFLKFKSRFWADNTLGTHYAPSYLDAKFGKEGKDEVLEAFIMGEKAELLSELEEDELIQLLLSELDQVYDGRASDGFISHYIINWRKSPFIQGAYSYSSIGMKDSRSVLAQPLDQKLFFAGEACHLNGHHQTVHGAFESGYEQALRVLLS